LRNIIYILYFYMIICIIIGCTSLNKKEKNIVLIISKKINKIEKKLKPIILWNSYIGEGIGKYYSYLHPANIGMLIFAADRYGVVKAINSLNGKKIWIQDLSISTGIMYKNNSALLSGGITASNKKLYIGSERAKVYALNIKDGNILWKSNVAGEVLSTPVIVSSYGLCLVHTSNGILQALNTYDGKIKWIVNLDIKNITIRGESTPTIIFGTTIIGGDNGIISSILLKNGQIIWQQHISYPSGITEITRINDIHSTPVIVNGIVYAIAYNGNIAAMDLRSGQIMWSQEIGSITNLLVKENSLYIIDQNDFLIAINTYDGMPLWCKKYLHSNITSIVLYKGYIITGDLQGYLHWINPYNGILVNKLKLNSSGFISTPIIANTNLVVETKNGIIYACIYKNK